MKVKVWGVRGSLPTPLTAQDVEEKIRQAIHGMTGVDTANPDAVRAYVAGLHPLVRGTVGGNTTCVEVKAAGATIIVDGGTGLRNLGLELMSGPCGQGQGTVHLFFSHAHWDHIQGFPFFTPAYVPGNRIVVYSHHDLELALTEQQRFLYFPVSLSFMAASLSFVRLDEAVPVTIGRVTVRSSRNRHPGDSFAYRFEEPRSVFVFASDAEYQDLDEASLEERRNFFRGADAVLFDAQYGLRESWESKANWGHSSAMIGVDLARDAGVKRLLLFHHEPSYSDAQLLEIQSTAIAYQAQTERGLPCEILLAHEGMELDLAPAGAIDVAMADARAAAILTPGSVFDEQGAQQLLARLSLVADRDNPVGSILDLTQVELLTTAGLKALVALSNEHAAGNLVLAGPSPAVEQVIRLAGYGDYFAIYPDVATALNAVQTRQILDLPGQMLGGRYQIIERIGDGHLGTLLKATDLRSQAPVALRILPANFGPDTLARFTRQAPQLLELADGRVARVLAIGQDDASKRTFIVEELLDGRTLEQRLATHAGRLPGDEAQEIAIDLALALERAHAAGAIHGNLKPQDVFLGRTAARICGFGLGRLAEGRNLREMSLLILDANYVAPEQILGQPLDARTDLYALGVILYRLFTGRLPFDEASGELLHAHLTHVPDPPREFNPDISRSLEHLIMRLLAKQPQQRYSGAQQVRKILVGLLQGGGEGRALAPRPLFGRAEPLAALQAWWREAEAGHGQLVFITGEPGVGKTRLAEEMAARAGAAVTLTGHCQAGQDNPYRPFGEALHAYFGTVPPELFDGDARALVANFASLVPELHRLLPDLPEPPALEPEHEQLRLIASLTQFLRFATRLRPWLLILEDLQWADQSSLDLLQYVGRHLPEMALCVVGIYRDSEVGPDHPLQTVLQQLASAPGYRRLAAARLGEAAVADILRQVWDPTVPDALVREIFRRTEGNPLFVSEVAKGLEDDGLVMMYGQRWHYPAAEAVRLPGSVHEAVEGRIHFLNPLTRDVLSAAAVLGPAFRFADLVALSGLSEWAVLEHLHLALERQLVQEVAGDNTLRFSHAEIHAVIYDDLGPLRRRRLHLRAGEVVERRLEHGDEGLTVELARHFVAAREPERGYRYSLAAARAAKRANANAAALHWYEQAAELCDQGVSDGVRASDACLLPVLQERGEALVQLGRWEEADMMLTQALRLAESLGDPRSAAHVQIVRGRLARWQGQLAEATTRLDQAESIFTELDDEPGLGQIYHEKGTVRAHQGDRPASRQLFERSLAIRRQFADMPMIARLLNNLGIIEVRAGDFESGESRYRESLQISRDLGDNWHESVVLSNLGQLLNLAEQEQAQAKLLLEEASRIQRELGTLPFLSITLHNLGNVNRDLGHFGEARAAYRECLSIYEQIGATQALPGLLADVAVLAASEGQYTQALTLFSAAETQHEVAFATVSPAEQFKLERLLAPARAALGAEDAQRAITRGRTLTLSEAFGYLSRDS
jgi:anti-anti-sigma factor